MHVHQPEFSSFAYESKATLDRTRFQEWADELNAKVYRAKGFVCFADGLYLFNFVAGRWDLESFEQDWRNRTVLVFIGQEAESHRSEILKVLESCEN